MLRIPLAACTIALGLACAACSTVDEHAGHASGDTGWSPTVATPTFSGAERPLVGVDAAHGNWHRIDGRYASFAETLRADGYRVTSLDAGFSGEALADLDVLVIANAVLGGEDSEWVLPTPQAIAPEEVAKVEAWVADGGSLFLIADHMPFPGSVSDLADAFGLRFLNGFARPSLTEGGTFTFARSDGWLTDHPVTRGRNDAEAVPSVKAFTGQAFGADRPVEPLMVLPDDWVVLLPDEAWEFDEATPSVPAKGLMQGAVFRHGKGRVAVFGEAAMFSTQTFEHEGRTIRVGMNDPEAPHNERFLINVMHWLSGKLDQ